MLLSHPWLQGVTSRGIVLLGHSFGGAVAVAAASGLCPSATADSRPGSGSSSSSSSRPSSSSSTAQNSLLQWLCEGFGTINQCEAAELAAAGSSIASDPLVQGLGATPTALAGSSSNTTPATGRTSGMAGSSSSSLSSSMSLIKGVVTYEGYYSIDRGSSSNSKQATSSSSTTTTTTSSSSSGGNITASNAAVPLASPASATGDYSDDHADFEVQAGDADADSNADDEEVSPVFLAYLAGGCWHGTAGMTVLVPHMEVLQNDCGGLLHDGMGCIVTFRSVVYMTTLQPSTLFRCCDHLTAPVLACFVVWRTGEFSSATEQAYDRLSATASSYARHEHATAGNTADAARATAFHSSVICPLFIKLCGLNHFGVSNWQPNVGGRQVTPCAVAADPDPPGYSINQTEQGLGIGLLGTVVDTIISAYVMRNESALQLLQQLQSSTGSGTHMVGTSAAGVNQGHTQNSGGPPKICCVRLGEQCPK